MAISTISKISTDPTTRVTRTVTVGPSVLRAASLFTKVLPAKGVPSSGGAQPKLAVTGAMAVGLQPAGGGSGLGVGSGGIGLAPMGMGPVGIVTPVSQQAVSQQQVQYTSTQDTSSSSDSSSATSSSDSSTMSGPTIDPTYGLDQTAIDNQALFWDSQGNFISVSDPNAYAALFATDQVGDGGPDLAPLVPQSVNLAEQLFSSGDQSLVSEQTSAWSAIQNDVAAVVQYYQFDTQDSTGAPARSSDQATGYRSARGALQDDINTWVSNSQAALATSPATTASSSGGQQPVVATSPSGQPVVIAGPSLDLQMMPTLDMHHHQIPWLLVGGLGLVAVIAFWGASRD